MTREISLGDGHVVLIDDEDFDFVNGAAIWRPYPSGNAFYAQGQFKLADGRWTTRYMHGCLTGWSLVDHVNRDGLDNRRANLRPATVSQNQANRVTRRDSRSGLKGVFQTRPNGRWRARITVNREVRSLGGYITAEEAARAYDAAAIEAFGEFARLNFPKENS